MSNKKQKRCTDGHRYRRFVNANEREQWKCMDCPSYTYNRLDIVGNEARCFYCGSKFTITLDKLRFAALKCGDTIEECRIALHGVISENADMISLYKQELEALARERAGDVVSEPESRSESEHEGESLLKSMMTGTLREE